jgi:hypothetical protein
VDLLPLMRGENQETQEGKTSARAWQMVRPRFSTWRLIAVLETYRTSITPSAPSSPIFIAQISIHLPNPKI